MKIIYSTGAYGEPYRIDVDDDLLHEARSAQRLLRMLPWNGEMFLDCPAKRLGGDLVLGLVELVVDKHGCWIAVDGPQGRENLLEGDNLFIIDEVHLTKSFEFDLEEHMFNLNEDDIRFIETWKQLKAEKLENS